MKTLLAICLIVAAPSIWAADTNTSAELAGAVVKGQVLESKHVGSYTYLRLKTADGETWAAVGKAPVKTGDKVTIENVMVMKDFESKALKKTFSTIVFGSLGASGGAASAGKGLPPGHPAISQAMDTQEIHVPKASGANAQTVADIITKRSELKDQSVMVRGKVVKYSPNIMGKNWIHLRDGSGSGASDTNDILVTTSSQTKIGDVVTAKGIVRIDKDFGAGYAYKVLIEDASLQP
jgi:hypothetical protein